MTTRYYGVFAADGVPHGFYPDDVYPPAEGGARNPAIPAGAVEISKVDWTALYSSHLARYVNGEITYVEDDPVPPPPPVRDANERLDAGVLAALDVVLAVKTAMQAIPDTFNNANFIATKIQLDALTEAMAAMLQGQAALPDLPGIIKPPAIKPP